MVTGLCEQRRFKARQMEWGRAVVDRKADLTVVAAQKSPTTKGGSSVVDRRAVDERGGWVWEEIGGRNVGK
ncbi:hypothetical protein L484_023362 [Morus notabilis]|uniref:Uncharacterized protein n=1 Tax=Morus notabilis TaxID=981085 RepID=W9SG12_9ROSA|nr:hypothetical protein L484_023362 [Morus notabilis]